MKKKMFFLSILFVLIASLANGYELATEISDADGKVVLSSTGYAKLNLIKIDTHSKGMIDLHGTVSVNGKANFVMWVKVEGNYYFSKLPYLQNIFNQKDVPFKIPFNAAEKTATEVILEVELLGAGQVEVDDIKLTND